MIQKSAVVDRSPRQVWDAVVDYESRPNWSPRVKYAEIIGGPPLHEGSRIRLHIGRDRLTARVVMFRPVERLPLRVSGPGFRGTHAYDLSPSGNATEVTMTGEFSGLFGRLAARFMRGSVEGDLSDELSAIKTSSEAPTR